MTKDLRVEIQDFKKDKGCSIVQATIEVLKLKKKEPKKKEPKKQKAVKANEKN